jgi:hypothetical protein
VGLATSVADAAAERIVVLEADREISFSFADMLDYHGGGSPGGVAHAFKVMQRGLPFLEAGGPVQRRAILIETAFGGPGARDAFELVTRAVSEARFRVDPSLARPEHGRARERFVFRLGCQDRAVTLTLREGFVTDEFIDLTRQDRRSVDEERRLTAMKSDMAARVMSAAAPAVYDVAVS